MKASILIFTLCLTLGCSVDMQPVSVEVNVPSTSSEINLQTLQGESTPKIRFSMLLKPISSGSGADRSEILFRMESLEQGKRPLSDAFIPEDKLESVLLYATDEMMNDFYLVSGFDTLRPTAFLHEPASTSGVHELFLIQFPVNADVAKSSSVYYQDHLFQTGQHHFHLGS